MALNYYILPTNIHNKLQLTVDISAVHSHSPPHPYISQSYCIYYEQLKTQLKTVATCHNKETEMHAPPTPTFYDMTEIITTLNILSFFSAPYIKALHVGSKHADYQYLSCLRNNPADKHFYLCENISNDYLFHYIFYDLDELMHPKGGQMNTVDRINKHYILQLAKAVASILKSQLEGGICVIKLTHIIHKPVLDLVYILLSVYEKALIIKPSTMPAVSHNKYLVCKGFVNKHAEEYHTKLRQWLQTIEGDGAMPDLLPSLPLYFLNKMTDINTVLGHKQLEAIDSLMFTIKKLGGTIVGDTKEKPTVK